MFSLSCNLMCSLISFKSYILRIEKSWQKYLVKMTMHKDKNCSFRNYVTSLCDLGRPFQKVWVNLRRTLWISFKDTSKLRSQGSSGKTIRGLTDSCSRIILLVHSSKSGEAWNTRQVHGKKITKKCQKIWMRPQWPEILRKSYLGSI